MLKKSLSQHLLKDKNLLNKIVRLSNITKDDVVVEIGAGQGDLTRHIAEKAGFLYAIELDGSFSQHLNLLEERYSNVKVIYGNILKIPFISLRKNGNLKIIGNIPYKITGPIVIKILKERSVIESAFLTMQKEIAQRIVSSPCNRAYGALSVNCQILSDVKVLFYIKPNVFIPPPKVDSALLSIIIKERERETDDGLIDFVKSCFQNKRKQLRQGFIRRYGEEKTRSLYKYMAFSYTVRAEEIEPLKFKEMYYFLENPFNQKSPWELS